MSTVPAIAAATKAKIKTTMAPAPGPHVDPNVGKKASMKAGVYAGMEGVIYSADAVNAFEVEGDFGETAHVEPVMAPRPYLLMLFYDDGKFFCAVPASLTEMNIVGGASPVPGGSGTPASPFACGTSTSAGSGSGTLYFNLPTNQSGTVKIDYNMYGAKDLLDVYFANDLTLKIASTGAPVARAGQVSFYYDHTVNHPKIAVKINDGLNVSGTSWTVTVNCPE